MDLDLRTQGGTSAERNVTGLPSFARTLGTFTVTGPIPPFGIMLRITLSGNGTARRAQGDTRCARPPRGRQMSGARQIQPERHPSQLQQRPGEVPEPLFAEDQSEGPRQRLDLKIRRW